MKDHPLPPDPEPAMPRARAQLEIQRAHDILHFLGTEEAPAVFKAEPAIAIHAAHDVLAWVLDFECGNAFESNLKAIQEFLAARGYQEIDVGRAISAEQARKEGLR